MMQDKWLCDMIVKKIKTNIRLDGISIRHGDYAEKELSKLINVATRNRAIVELYKEQTYSRNRTSTLVFAADVKHIYDLVEEFRMHGIDARGLDGNTKSHIRQSLISDFRQSKFPVLINCGKEMEHDLIYNM